MNFKKFLLLLITITILAGCNNRKDEDLQPEPPSNIDEQVEGDKLNENAEGFRVAFLKGPTGMGGVKLIEENNEGNLTILYEFEIKNSPDEIVPMLIKGDLDFAAIPANLASIVYANSNKEISVIGINTLGVLYLIEGKENINSIDDLKGKTIYSSGKGATPEFTLNFILESNGFDLENDVNIEFKSEHTEILALLEENEDAVAVLPEPFVSSIISKKPNFRKALDLTKEWERVSPGTKMITGVVVARNEVINKFPEVVSSFLDEYKKSVDFVNNNVDEAGKLIAKHDIFEEEVAKLAIPYSNITLITGDEMESDLSFYLDVLFKSNPESIGGTMPDEKFYYKK